MTRRRPRLPRWTCLVVLDETTGEVCRAWGFADPGEDPGALQHQHFLEHHYKPSEDDDD